MQINEYKERVVTQKVRKGLKCDNCEKTTSDPDDPTFAHIESSWECYGDVERVENDVCSLDCYIKQLKKLTEEAGDSCVLQIDGKTLEFVKSMIRDYEKRN